MVERARLPDGVMDVPGLASISVSERDGDDMIMVVDKRALIAGSGSVVTRFKLTHYLIARVQDD